MLSSHAQPPTPLAQTTPTFNSSASVRWERTVRVWEGASWVKPQVSNWSYISSVSETSVLVRMEFLPDLKILIETGSAGNPQQPKEKKETRRGLIGPSNLKVNFQESLNLGSAVIRNSPSIRTAFLCWLYYKTSHSGLLDFPGKQNFFFS